MVVLLLHFWGGSSRTWAPVNSLIASFVPTIRIDFRGWGKSIGPTDETAYSVTTLAQDVEQVIIRLDVQKYILVGHSMGAKVAQAIARRKRVSGLLGTILLCPEPPTSLVLLERIRDQRVGAYDDSTFAEFVVRHVLTSNNLSGAILQTTVQDMLKGNASVKRPWPLHAMGEDIARLAEGMSMPLVVVAGEKDKVGSVDRVEAEVGGSIPSVKLIILEDVGHLALLEAPDKVAEVICDLVSQVA
jgi:pimeloyl-ACP methyl ester carboxylesterase